MKLLEPAALNMELRACEDFLNGKGLYSAILAQIVNKLVWALPVFLSMSVVRAAQSTGLIDFLDCLCGLLAQYSGGTATLFLAFRRKQMAQFIGHMRVVAERFEVENQPYHREVTMIPALWMRTVRYAAGWWVAVGFVLMTFQVTLPMPMPTTPDFTETRWWPLTAVTEVVKWVFCGGSFFTLWMLVTSSAATLVGLYHSLIVRATTALGTSGVRQVLEQHQQVCLLEEEMSRLFYRFLLHYMFGVCVVPLINTIQMLQSNQNLFTFMTFSTLPATLGSFSLLGEMLTQSSGELAEAAYGVPWMDAEVEPTTTRRARQLIIARALLPLQPNKGSLAMIGFGSFTLVSALAYIRAWYSYLQLLLRVVPQH